MRTIKFEVPTKAEVQQWAREFVQEEINRAGGDIWNALMEEFQNREFKMIKDNPTADDSALMENIPLSTRLRGVLRDNNLITVGDVCSIREAQQWLKLRNLGPFTLAELKYQLKRVGRELGDRPTPATTRASSHTPLSSSAPSTNLPVPKFGTSWSPE